MNTYLPLHSERGCEHPNDTHSHTSAAERKWKQKVVITRADINAEVSPSSPLEQVPMISHASINDTLHTMHACGPDSQQLGAMVTGHDNEQGSLNVMDVSTGCAENMEENVGITKSVWTPDRIRRELLPDLEMLIASNFTC